MQAARRRKFQRSQGPFYSAAEAAKKNCAAGGGFQAGFPLTHMNRHNNHHAGKTKTKP